MYMEIFIDSVSLLDKLIIEKKAAGIMNGLRVCHLSKINDKANTKWQTHEVVNLPPLGTKILSTCKAV